jgi:hypothetical protein
MLHQTPTTGRLQSRLSFVIASSAATKQSQSQSQGERLLRRANNALLAMTFSDFKNTLTSSMVTVPKAVGFG